MIKQRRILPPGSPALKPQNQISDTAREKAVCAFRDWLISFELPVYHARMLASEIISRAISERIKATAASAASVFISDKDKIESLVSAGKKIADTLDEEGALESLIEELEIRDAQRDGNSL